MQIIIPLSHFVDYLNQVKQKRRTWLDEREWLIDNFRFDNESALMIRSQSQRRVTIRLGCAGIRSKSNTTFARMLYRGFNER